MQRRIRMQRPQLTIEELTSMSKVKSKVKKEVIEQAQKEGKPFHFASLVDLCHLKDSNWNKSSQNTKAVLHYVATL